MAVTIQEIVEVLGNNVESIEYNAQSEVWLITYKNGILPDRVETDDLYEFLRDS